MVRNESSLLLALARQNNIDVLGVLLTDFNLKQNLIIRYQCQLSTLPCASLSALVIQHRSIFHRSTPDPGCFLRNPGSINSLLVCPTYPRFTFPGACVISVIRTNMEKNRQLSHLKELPSKIFKLGLYPDFIFSSRKNCDGSYTKNTCSLITGLKFKISQANSILGLLLRSCMEL